MTVSTRCPQCGVGLQVETDPDTLAAVASYVRAERARIREELLAELEPWTRWDRREFGRVLDRICHEEPA